MCSMTVPLPRAGTQASAYSLVFLGLEVLEVCGVETQAFPGFLSLCLGGMVCFSDWRSVGSLSEDPEFGTRGWSLGAWNLAVPSLQPGSSMARL